MGELKLINCELRLNESNEMNVGFINVASVPKVGEFICLTNRTLVNRYEVKEVWHYVDNVKNNTQIVLYVNSTGR